MIGITERGDAALDTSWKPWVKSSKPAILITKDSAKLVEILNREFNHMPNIIVHCTITGWGGSKLEPHVDFPALEISHGYHELRKMLGPDRVVLRIDPIIPTLAGERLAYGVYNTACGIVGQENLRTRISFLDLYPHVKQRFQQIKFELPWTTFHAPLERRQAVYDQLKQDGADLEVCGEPDFECTGCVSKRDLEILRHKEVSSLAGQRPTCACLAAKHELLTKRGQCENCCAYCYWK